eukprot:TRINITY_DN1090_c0_g2_i2.p1 TRINITY_DN1090_c0_g2~~TRINITY_DN1090_c0_g2_i2.p1  ORF type:complete len:189 (+),score=39.99 TRINITY_DN1090_c0_g2_i2:2-568(+)
MMLWGSPQALFMGVYEEFFPVFKKVSQGYWNDFPKNTLLQKLTKAYSIRSQVDWYRLSMAQVTAVNGKIVPKKKMICLLEFSYPEEEWDHFKFSERINKRARQRFLGMRLVEVFKKEVILENHVVRSGQQMYVFDFYVPGVHLAIEYQGEQHYYSIMNWMPCDQQKCTEEGGLWGFGSQVSGCPFLVG